MDIFTTLLTAADPVQADKMSAYMRRQFVYLGIPTPKRKELTKDFLKAYRSIDWSFIEDCWQRPEREFQYLAIDCLIKTQNQLKLEDLPKLRNLVINRSWWDTVDALDVIIGDLALHYPEINETLKAWSVDENIWLRRIAIDHQLTRKDKTDTALMEEIIVNNFGTDEFFINKAIGWSLRQYSKTNPLWVKQFIEKYRDKLAPLSISEASKYL